MAPPADANANANVEQKVLQYEAFLDEVLRRDLQKVMEQRDQVYEKISQYLQLKNTIQSLQEAGSQQLKTDVDLGCNFYVQAEIEDSSRILVSVGFGFFVEMTHDEALRFVEKKTNQLTAFTEQLTKDSAKIKAHIRMVLEGLRGLQGLTDLPEARRRDIF
ncbi:protein UXT isoform X2 [Melanotaenia boesemani]|uniref:protein UXT isoform X2 n=1 Tax=Melanotaenia boesemani TaxID=1250792 RepID=UPI001C052287|nr:protein UXT isoform X2 [Melanotaenia boesemani]